VKLEKIREYNEAVHQLFVANNTVRRDDLYTTVSALGVRMKPITLLKMFHLQYHVCDVSLFWKRIREVDRGRRPIGKIILQGILKK
jgi:hypothetical protein